LFINSSVIFKLWPNEWLPLPSLISYPFFFVKKKKTTTNLLFYHKSNFYHHKSDHHNTQFVSIIVLIQFFWGFPTSSKQNNPFFVRTQFSNVNFYCIFFYLLYVVCLCFYLFYSLFLIEIWYECMICKC